MDMINRAAEFHVVFLPKELLAKPDQQRWIARQGRLELRPAQGRLRLLQADVIRLVGDGFALQEFGESIERNAQNGRGLAHRCRDLAEGLKLIDGLFVGFQAMAAGLVPHPQARGDDRHPCHIGTLAGRGRLI